MIKNQKWIQKNGLCLDDTDMDLLGEGTLTKQVEICLMKSLFRHNRKPSKIKFQRENS